MSSVTDLILSGGMDRCSRCGEEKRNRKGVVVLTVADGQEHAECACYDCMAMLEAQPNRLDGRTERKAGGICWLKTHGLTL